MKTPVQLRQEAAQLADEALALLETAEGEARDLNEQEEARYSELESRIKSLHKQAERLEALEGFTGVAKPEPDKRDAQMGAPAYHRRPTRDEPNAMYCRYLRTGDPGVVSELRAYNDTDMNVTTAADGEVVVPVGMVNDIAAKRDEMALFPRMGVVRVPGKGTTVNYPVDNEADVVFASVSEGGNVLRDAPALTEKAFTLVKYGKYIQLTWELLRDEDAMLLSFLNNWVGRGWAATHNSALVTEVLANGTAGLTLDAAAAVDETEVPELVGKLAPEYQDGAQWLMHQGTFSHITALTGNPFQFAPTPGGSPGVRTLWNYPVNLSSYMTAYAASVKSLVFGNFQFLGMREGTGLTTLRDPYTSAGTGGIKLWYWFDLVYGVLQAEAIQYATHPSA